MHAAGLQRRIERLTELIDGLQREMEAVQSDHALLNWQEYPDYLGALLKAQQGCTAAKIALEAVSDRLAGKKPGEPW